MDHKYSNRKKYYDYISGRKLNYMNYIKWEIA